MSETIYAPATAPGKSGVAIVRISGPASVDVLKALGGQPPEPRMSRLCRLHGSDGEVLDQALVLYFAERASFTGEDVVELQCHGSMAVVKAILTAIGQTGLARLAEPGEFTRRALLNNQLDFTQVQGLADLIDSDTEAQRRHAMRVFDGELTRTVQGWRRDLIRARALLEATIDFADEDVPEDVRPEVRELIRGVMESLKNQVLASGAAEQIRNGFDVAIIGAPNVGKSTLLNALTRSDAAIVSEVAGTTRDLIEVRLDIDGCQINLIDTAGLRKTDDPVERIGVEKARNRAKEADLRVFLYTSDGDSDLNLPLRDSDVRLRSKVDLADGSNGISALTGQGIPELLGLISERASSLSREAGLVTRSRDLQTVEAAIVELNRIERRVSDDEAELLASDVAFVTDRLADIIGGVDVEGILDEVFSSFCLGK
ncbi:tRNA uridine-5-carboxymethylaminomethyl(34) synthesis GTPase MnmE [uncultured Jannaschia sp.]|uniref:tRNA uridine-5-carboxymethylaminomethyl(34) synthesis GTPase MnmE n=1 Tax=uncultured Jannaschia sp. TaxID=293347 RepID=UPI002639A5C2|nr:tRNA uridine-5-carboxymethylaminomethyl(34) synthesis GTPase MnmE [uncultured Jannaschia sp.]